MFYCFVAVLMLILDYSKGSRSGFGAQICEIRARLLKIGDHGPLGTGGFQRVSGDCPGGVVWPSEVARECPEPHRGCLLEDKVSAEWPEPYKKYWFLGFLTRDRGVRGPPGGPPGLSVGLSGASGGPPEAPGT